MVSNRGIRDPSLHPFIHPSMACPPFHFCKAAYCRETDAQTKQRGGSGIGSPVCLFVEETDIKTEIKRMWAGGQTETCTVGLMLESSPLLLFLLTLHYGLEGRRERMSDSIIDNVQRRPIMSICSSFILSQAGLRRSRIMLLKVFLTQPTSTIFHSRRRARLRTIF